MDLVSADPIATDFVTVVTVGTSEDQTLVPPTKTVDTNANIPSAYVTVLKIGDTNKKKDDTVTNNELNTEIVEEVLVYRLPGERLGFGLKFEGGTKSAEFVKRLFIQSCAPDSPASRVQSSWGCLTEGDEVLEIDSIPVNNMTRIDCVRCLKDSNVVIKLLVKHFPMKPTTDETTNLHLNEVCFKSLEDMPHVVGAEKKRSPPPPPPIPPRKIGRKSAKDPAAAPAKVDVNIETPPVPPVRQQYNVNSCVKILSSHRLQSPRNSGRMGDARERLNSGPPDAEVYLDLFAQENEYSLRTESESDDTGSSISTIVDRLSSFPATSNSSFSDSLPSTPTALKKRMDITLLNPFDSDEFQIATADNYLVTKLMSSENIDDMKPAELKRAISLQPPASFQDAPLSCGNEDMRFMESGLIMTKLNNNRACDENSSYEANLVEIQVKNIRNLDNENEIKRTETTFRSGKKRPPPPPPTFNNKDMPTAEKNNNYIKAEESLQFNLPRLVDFVPKRSASDENLNCCMEDVVKTFLENEIKTASEYESLEYRTKIQNNCISDSDASGYFWSPCSQLATIGEDEEENNFDSSDQPPAVKSQRTSIIIIENVDESSFVEDKPEEQYEVEKTMEQQEAYFDRSASNVESSATNSDSDGTMEAPPSSSRQPPDGDEFPVSYQENASVVVNDVPTRKTPVPKPVLPYNFNVTEEQKPKHQVPNRFSSRDQKVTSVKDRIAIFSSQPQQQVPSSLTSTSKFSRAHKSTDDVFKSLDQVDLSQLPSAAANLENVDKCENKRATLNGYSSLTHKSEDDSSEPQRLHSRSQSLVDVTAIENASKSDKWSILMEQRRKGMSKLKGLVIPERVVEVETQVQPVIDLPEIRSKDAPPAPLADFKMESKDNRKPQLHQRNLSNPSFVLPPLNPSAVPKYSPAFKRKSLQVYNIPNANSKQQVPASKNATKYSYDSSFTSECHLPVTNLPKSLPLNDAPKSLESITSPTRSDCSFEYSCSSPDLKQPLNNAVNQVSLKTQEAKINAQGTNSHNTKVNLDIGSGNESDNDSAVSSSQSSYCRMSPPMSPNDMQSNSSTYNVYETSSTVFLSSSECDKSTDDQEDSSSELQSSSKYNSLSRRVLKPQSVDAINRKNILASAKCRSGRDLKVGSPLIQRKFDEDENGVPNPNPKDVQAVHYSVTTASNNVDLQNVNIAYEEVVEELVELVPEKAPVSNGAEIDQVPEKKCVKKEEVIKPIEKERKEKPAPVIENYKSAKEELKKVVVPKRISIESAVRPSASKAKASVNDIKKSFEKMTPVPALRHSITTPKNVTNVTPTKRLSLDSKASSKLKSETVAPIETVAKVTEVPQIEITKQAIEELIKENNIDVSKQQDVIVVNLQRECVELSVGITLAGGSDYETKEITVHSVRKGSPAYKNGQIQKGDRILAINGKTMKGVTHSESISLLKSPNLQVSLVVHKMKNVPAPTAVPRRSSLSTAAPKVKDSPSKMAAPVDNSGSNFEVNLNKDIGGLGFSISGGQDSPLGDMPLLIKKLFTGGVAEKCGKLQEGDQLLAVNDVDVTSMSRIEAWGLMKKLPEGASVKLTVKR